MKKSKILNRLAYGNKKRIDETFAPCGTEFREAVRPFVSSHLECTKSLVRQAVFLDGFLSPPWNALLPLPDTCLGIVLSKHVASLE